MKRWVVILVSIIGFIQSNAQVKWDGEAGDSNWNSALNWSANAIPSATDQVLLDNSFVSDSYVVSLPAGNVSITVSKLEVIPSSSSIITLINPGTNTSSTAFTATGPGDAIIIGNGAIFINASGASSGTPVSVGSTNFFRINNGGRYIHRTARGHTDFLVSRLSTASGTEMGIFEFDVPSTASYTVSGSNRVYGQLVLSAQASGGTKTYASSGSSPLQIKTDLILKSNVVFSYGANTNSIIINRNCQLEVNAVFNISNGANNSSVVLKGNLLNNGLITESGTSTGSGIVLNGSTAQTIEGTGSIIQTVQLTINNPSGVVLNSNLKIPYRLQLVSGNIFSADSRLVIVQDNALCIGASSASFVEGPIKKVGDDDFLFPVGKGNIYAPVSIFGGGNITDEFTAEYFRANPQSGSGLGNVLASTIHHISFVEYWLLKQDIGNSSRIVGLSVTPQSFARILNTLKVARFDMGVWRDEGGAAFVSSDPIPPYITGSFQSVAPLNNFGFFTIGTSDTYIVNPLPLKLISFTNEVTGNGYCKLIWVMDEGDYHQTDFEIQRSFNGIDFSPIGKVRGINNQSKYFMEDRSAQEYNNYYRLKVVDSTATVFYSKVLHQSAKSVVPNIIIAPTVVDQILRIRYQTRTPDEWEWVLLDLTGNILWKTKEKINLTFGTKQIDVSSYRPGIYFLSVRTKSGMVNVSRWIKR